MIKVDREIVTNSVKEVIRIIDAKEQEEKYMK